eukprot:1950984-Rhodomonas_salina.2
MSSESSKRRKKRRERREKDRHSRLERQPSRQASSVASVDVGVHIEGLRGMRLPRPMTASPTEHHRRNPITWEADWHYPSHLSGKGLATCDVTSPRLFRRGLGCSVVDRNGWSSPSGAARSNWTRSPDGSGSQRRDFFGLGDGYFEHVERFSRASDLSDTHRETVMKAEPLRRVCLLTLRKTKPETDIEERVSLRPLDPLMTHMRDNPPDRSRRLNGRWARLEHSLTWG